MTGDPSSGEQHSISPGSTGNDVTASPPTGPEIPQGSSNYVQKIRIRLKSHPVTERAYKITVGVIGSLVVIIGLVLVPFPGPGWLIVIVGLLILASEFERAARVLHFVRSKVDAWVRWIGRQPLFVRAGVGLGAMVFAASVFYGMLVLTGVPAWVPVEWVPSLPGLKR